MILYPAIDLKGGQCVRLYQGDMARATVFGHDPAAQARAFEAAGCAWIHVVDLDGALAGRTVNGAAVEAILAAVSVPVQLGGGIRDLESAAAWLERGVARIVLGTLAVRSPELALEACRCFAGQIAIGIDARAGRVAVEGWTETTEVLAGDLALLFEDAGPGAFVYTDIARDGALAGVNAAAVAGFARPLKTPVIASGGVRSLDDLRALKAVEDAGVAGVICGRAIYEGLIAPAEAVAVLAA